MKTIACYLFTILLMLSCSPFKNELAKSGGRNEVIQNAIVDFSKSRLFKRDTVYSVTAGEENGNFIVRVGRNTTKLLLTSSTKPGTKSKVLPTRFLEKEGRLFIWWDEDFELSKEAIAVYHKFKLFQDDEGGVITVPEFISDDSKKAAHYYFCKNNLSKYKRVITNIGIGYYDSPKLNCDN